MALISKTLAYWQNSTMQERIVILLLFVLSLLLLTYTAYWRPVHKNILELRILVPQERWQLDWMRKQTTRIPQNTSMTVSHSGGLLPLIEKSVDTHGLQEQLARLEPKGESEANLALKNVVYRDLIKWLVNLQRQHGISVHSANILSTKNVGLVDANFVLRRGL